MFRRIHAEIKRGIQYVSPNAVFAILMVLITNETSLQLAASVGNTGCLHKPLSCWPVIYVQTKRRDGRTGSMLKGGPR
jgi:hypothetical protein